MTDLVIAWENWRSSWYNYEDVIIDLINNKDERWLKIVEFISNDTCISLDEYIFRAIKSPKTVEDAVLNWRKKRRIISVWNILCYETRLLVK